MCASCTKPTSTFAHLKQAHACWLPRGLTPGCVSLLSLVVACLTGSVLTHAGTGKHGVQPEDVGGWDTTPPGEEEKGRASSSASSSTSSCKAGLRGGEYGLRVHATSTSRTSSTSDDEGTLPHRWALQDACVLYCGLSEPNCRMHAQAICARAMAP